MVEQQQVTVPAGPAPAGPQRMQRRYLDDEGRYRTSAVPVPTDEFGRLTARPFRCRRCTGIRWVPKARMKAGGPAPMCEVHERPMVPASLRRSPAVPLAPLWAAVGRPLRPVWALPVLAGAGVAVDAGQVPGVVPLVAAPLVAEVTRRVVRGRQVRVQVEAGNLDADDPQAHKRRRAAIDRAARACGYAAGSAAGWLTLPAALGVEPGTWPGRLVWSAGLGVWLVSAATWWRRDRLREAPRQVVEDAPLPVDDGPRMDPAEAEVRRIWASVLACRQGDVVGHNRDGQPVRAKRDARLAGTRLEDWHTVSGGWAATIVGPIGAYESETFLKAVGAIASAFSVRKSMVTVIPDPDDENRSTVMIQRVSPIASTPRWPGPSSIDVPRGRAQVMTYADGEPVWFEFFRPGWGCPHVAVFGSTGVAKSSFAELLFVIGRYMQHEGRGLVADFLIDPQQGQSFPDFIEELAAPPACSLPEAMLLAEALTEEALRRNRYLAREAKWWDGRRQQWRTGRKWWDPLVDGPILALTIDEAHDYLSYRPFATLITKAGRMWRKCGLQLRILTHTPLLADLGGSMALRDMLAGGFVWMGRVNNSLSGPVAFNGRLPVDPRLIPQEPGMAYPLAGTAPRPMLARTMWQEDWYDYLRGADGARVGFPAELPAETLAAFDRVGFSAWARAAAAGELWTPGQPAAGGSRAVVSVPASAPSEQLTGAVLRVLAEAGGPVDMGSLDAGLRRLGVDGSTLTVRAALAELRDGGLVVTDEGRRHALTAAGRERVAGGGLG